jgi:hypothetical protein
MNEFCLQEKQMMLDGTFFLLKISHKWKEGYVFHGVTKVYKKQCVKCGFVDWEKKSDKKIDLYPLFSLY